MFRYRSNSTDKYPPQDEWITTSNDETTVETIDATKNETASDEKQITSLTEENTIDSSNIENTPSNLTIETNISDNNSDSSDSDSIDTIDSDNNTDLIYYAPNKYHLVDNSDVFVILKDLIPQFYLQNRNNARKSMWDTARFYRAQWCNDYNVYIREGVNADKIQIYGYYKFFIFSYERLITSFEIKSVKELFDKGNM